MSHIKVIFDRKKTAAKTGTGKIDISIYLTRDERKYETVGTATPNDWETVAMSKNVVAKVKHYEQVLKAMQLFNEDMTIENFNKHIFVAQAPTKPEEKVLFNGNDLRQSFVEFCREHMENEDLRPNSIKNFKVVFDAIEDSGKLNTLADLTPTNIKAFDAWLHAQKNKNDKTIFNYHKKVHKYTHILWRMEMISSDPYNHVTFNKGSYGERVPLIEEELIKIREAEYTGHIERARDMFVFMAYTGLAYCDMKEFNFNTMAEKHSDYWYIDGSRLKTGSKFFTPILPPAMEVLKKYDYKLPIISNQKLNDYCRVFKDHLKINKQVTCHVARHSFATLMLTYGIPMEQVQRMLGHKNITTTQLYGKVLKKSVEDKVNTVLTTLR